MHIFHLTILLISACRKKKLKDGVCVICKGQIGQQTCRARIRLEELNETVTIFENHVSLLFQVNDFTTEDKFLNDLLAKLPLKFRGKVSGGRLFNISVRD